MPNYHRYHHPGGCYFFTVNLLQRFPNELLTQNIDILRASVKKVKTRLPFHIDAWVVLPDHMHCIWTLPKGDQNFATWWRLIKTHFVKAIPKVERHSIIRIKRGERAIWQRRYWEHFIRDDNDYQRHIDYLHYNPVKHGYVSRRVWLASFDFSSISGTRDLPRKLGHWECWWIRRRWVCFSL